MLNLIPKILIYFICILFNALISLLFALALNELLLYRGFTVKLSNIISVFSCLLAYLFINYNESIKQYLLLENK